jgi:hypothetical protein
MSDFNMRRMPRVKPCKGYVVLGLFSLFLLLLFCRLSFDEVERGNKYDDAKKPFILSGLYELWPSIASHRQGKCAVVI